MGNDCLAHMLDNQRVNGFLSPSEALRERLLQVTRDGQYETPFKLLQSGLTVAKKMAITSLTVVPAD